MIVEVVSTTLHTTLTITHFHTSSITTLRYLDQHSQTLLHTTSTITHSPNSTLRLTSLTAQTQHYLNDHSQVATPHYLNHHSRIHTTSTITRLHTTSSITHGSTLLQPSLTACLHTTSIITHILTPHYLNHHSQPGSTLPQPSLTAWVVNDG